MGGTKPWNSRSSWRATSMHCRSPNSGPTICTPIGKPFEKPAGATVEGSDAHREISAPESRIGGRRLASFHDHLPLMPGVLGIVRHGDRRRRRTDQHVPFLEERLPGAAQQVAGAVELAPVGVGEDLLRRSRCRTLGGHEARAQMGQPRPELLVALARREAGHQQAAEDAEGRGGVDRRAGAVADLGAILGEEIGNRLDTVLDLGVDVEVGIVAHHRDLEVAEPPLARRRQLEAPRHGVIGNGSGDQRQRELEVVGTARQRSGDGEVGFFPDARHDMAHPVGDAIGRLVAVDAAIVCDVAHAAAEIDAELQPGQPGGQRRRRAAR